MLPYQIVRFRLKIGSVELLNPARLPNFSSAVQSELKVGAKKASVGIQYRRVDPDYKSMGAYFFQTDVSAITLRPRFNLKEGKLILLGSIGIQHDNLYGQNLATTRRVIGSGQLSWQPGPNFGGTAQYSNYGFSQTPLDPNLPDTLVIAQISQQALLNLRIGYGDGLRQSIVPTFQFFQLSGLDPSIGSLRTMGVSLGYQLQHPRARWSQQVQVLWRSSTTYSGQLRTLGLSWNGQRPFLKNKLITSATIAWYLNRSPESMDQGNLINANARLIYRLMKSQSLQLQYSWRRNRAPDSGFGTDFSEHRASLIYALHF